MNRKEHIGNQGGEWLDEDRLLAYLDGTMPAGEQHALEEILESDPFLNDAVEGLAELKDKQQIRSIAAQINVHLRKQIQNRRKQRRSRPKLTDHWGWIFVLVILLIVIISWLVMKASIKIG